MDNLTKLDDNHHIARFAPEAAALQQAAAEGYRSIVNLRTEAEDQNLQPDAERELVEDANMTYLHYPVSPDALSSDLVDGFRANLAELPRPILFHCASGKRAGAMTLMDRAMQHGWNSDTALDKGREAGLDLPQDGIGGFVKKYLDGKG